MSTIQFSAFQKQANLWITNSLNLLFLLALMKFAAIHIEWNGFLTIFDDFCKVLVNLFLLCVHRKIVNLMLSKYIIHSRHITVHIYSPAKMTFCPEICKYKYCYLILFPIPLRSNKSFCTVTNTINLKQKLINYKMEILSLLHRAELQTRSKELQMLF